MNVEDLEERPAKKTKRGHCSESAQAQNEDALQNVFSILDVSNETREVLKSAGITTLTSLLSRKDSLAGNEVDRINPRTQRNLFKVCLWYAQQDELGINPSEADFTDAAFSNFEETGSGKLQLSTLFAQAKTDIHKSATGSDATSALNTPAVLERVTAFGADLVIKGMPRELTEKCNQSFDHKEFATRWIKSILNLPSGTSYPNPFLVTGRTQSGKSLVKALMIAVGKEMMCPSIIITKGVSESIDLCSKLKTLSGPRAENNIQALGRYSKARSLEVRNLLNDGGALIIADTAAQIGRAKDYIEDYRENTIGFKFSVIVDECDSMYRTEDGSQKMEKAYMALMMLQPAVRILITATPVPALLTLLNKDKQDPEMMKIEANPDYVGLEQMTPLKDTDGTPLYCMPGCLPKHSDGVPYPKKQMKGLVARQDKNPLLLPDRMEIPGNCGKCRGSKRCAKHSPCTTFTWPTYSDSYIPYTNDDVMRLYEDALAPPVPKKGVLILNCTNPRVQAAGNIFQLAACIQNHYFRQEKQIAVIVCIGRGVFVRRPGHKNGRSCAKTITLSDAIQSIDREYGLEMPVAVFGFTKMRRCVSCRSDQRFPTHIVLSMGMGHCVENLGQALGRATGNGASVLKTNGFHEVTILTLEEDWLVTMKYQNFVSEIHDRVKNGEQGTAGEALGSNEIPFSDNANFQRHSKRRIGQQREPRLDLLLDPHMYNGPENFSDAEKRMKDKYSLSGTTQILLEHILEFAEIEQFEFEFEDIWMACTKSEEDMALKKSAVRKELKMFVDDNVLGKRMQSAGGTRVALWSIKSKPLIRWLLETDEEMFLDEAVPVLPHSSVNPMPSSLICST